LDRGLILNQILLKIGGSRVDDEAGWANFNDRRVVGFLLKHGREFPTEGLKRLQETPFPDYRQPFDPLHCHRNCVYLCCYVGTGQSEYQMVHGWALSKDEIWYCHSWCIKRTGTQNVIETTAPRIAYFGFAVPDKINLLGTFWVPSTLGDELESWESGRM
jgi:hypothetical protein